MKFFGIIISLFTVSSFSLLNKIYETSKLPQTDLKVINAQQTNFIKSQWYSKLMEDIDMQVLHYYPEDFEISTYLKKWLWLCKPKLPDIDINLLLSKL